MYHDVWTSQIRSTGKSLGQYRGGANHGSEWVFQWEQGPQAPPEGLSLSEALFHTSEPQSVIKLSISLCTSIFQDFSTIKIKPQGLHMEKSGVDLYRQIAHFPWGETSKCQEEDRCAEELITLIWAVDRTGRPSSIPVRSWCRPQHVSQERRSGHSCTLYARVKDR